MLLKTLQNVFGCHRAYLEHNPPPQCLWHYLFLCSNRFGINDNMMSKDEESKLELLNSISVYDLLEILLVFKVKTLKKSIKLEVHKKNLSCKKNLLWLSSGKHQSYLPPSLIFCLLHSFSETLSSSHIWKWCQMCDTFFSNFEEKFIHSFQ